MYRHTKYLARLAYFGNVEDNSPVVLGLAPVTKAATPGYESDGAEV